VESVSREATERAGRRCKPGEGVALALLLLLTLAFFWKLAFTNLILAGLDSLLYFYPYKAYAAEMLRVGHIPLWNPYLFMGVPFLANIQSAVLYPLNWPLIWLPPPQQVSISIVLHVFLSAAFTYACCRISLGLGRSGALVAALVFALGGFVGAQVEHVNQLNGMAWLPLLFLLFDVASGEQGQGENRWRSGVATLSLGAVMALQILAGHTQTAYISICGLGLYALLLPVRETTHPTGERGGGLRFLSLMWLREVGRRAIVLILALIVGAGLSAAQVLPTAELSGLSVRSGGLTYREAAAFSLRPHLLLYTLLPAFGEDLSQVFASEGFGEYVSYVGVIPLALAAVGLVEGWRRWPRVRSLAFLAAAGLFLALGLYNPFYYLLYKVVPGISLFRVPARWMLLYSFAVALLAGVGVECLLDERTARLPALSGLLSRLRQAPRGRVVAGMAILLTILLSLLYFLDFPGALAIAAWAGLAVAGGGLIMAARRTGLRSALAVAAVVMVALELFLASRGQVYNVPTAPGAFSLLRPSIAHLWAAAQAEDPLYRVVSLSGIAYDPGDQRDIEQMFARQLPAKAIYNYIVAAKEKEVLFFNLPLLYHLYSVDGYDGGLLPLRRFVDLQRLFLDENDLSLDGRLRERLRQVPEGRLLSLLNVRYIITDKVYDVWIDGIFYDLQFTALLGPGGVEEIEAEELPDFPATSLGIVSYLQGAADLPQGAPVAEVVVADADGWEGRYPLRAGVDTAEGEYSKAGMVAHQQARVGHHWRDNPGGNDYITLLDLGGVRRLRRVAIVYRAPRGALHLRGVSLVDQRTETSKSLTLSTSGRFRLVHSGDVKIYENLDALPRAYLVHRARVEPDDLAAVAAMRDPGFNPAEEAILAEGAPLEAPASAGEYVRIARYDPERVEVEVKAAAEGYLVLSDTYYPGWEVTLDGRPARLLRANLMFRGVYLPPGEHRVVFTYTPWTWRVGLGISVATALLLLAGGATGWRRRRGVGVAA
jgi:hypothetical protein